MMLPRQIRRSRALMVWSFIKLLLFLFINSAWSFVVGPRSSLPNTQAAHAPMRAAAARRSQLKMASGWTSGISHESDGVKAVKDLLKPLEKNKESEQDGLVFMFVNPAHAKNFSDMVRVANDVLPKGQYQLLALVGGGVIGGGTEIDPMNSEPSVSILYGNLPPGSNATTFGIVSDRDETAPWKENNKGDNDRPPSYILFVDPLGYMLFVDPWESTSKVLEEIDSSTEDGGPVVVVGGLSCPVGVTDSSVAYNNRCLPVGSIAGVRFEGNVGIQSLVAQGCRPVGPTFVVTAAVNNVILELSGLSALEQLEHVVSAEASSQDKAIIQAGGLLGGVISDPSSRKDAKNDDFLARQIIGFQPRMNEGSGEEGGNKGSIVIATPINAGDLFRFHVRDTAAAQQDFEIMVQRYKTERMFSMEGSDSKAGSPLAALQISCVARGQSLFGRPNVDLEQTQELFSKENSTRGEEGTTATFSEPPVSGFFANGEIGPVGLAGFSDGSGGPRTHVHGFTTVVAMLCDFNKRDDESSGASLVDATTRLEESSEAWG